MPLPPLRSPSSVRPSATLLVEVATALVCVAVCWLLVRFGPSESAGSVEREHLATHAALALALLVLPWAMSSGFRWRPSIWAFLSPFLALAFLPAGLRRFGPLVLLVVCLATLWSWLRQTLHTRPALARPLLLSFALFLAAWASAGAAVAVLMRPDAVPVPLDPRALLGVLVRGAAFGASLCWLRWEWRGRAGDSAALGLAGAALVTSGPSLTAALVLAACAGTSTWTRRRTPAPGQGRRAADWGPLIPWVPLAALAPSTAALLGFGTWGSRVRRGWLAALIVSTALGALWLAPRPWEQSAVDLGLAALLFGPMWLALRSDPTTPSGAAPAWRLASATALAVVGLRFFPSHLVLTVVAAQILRPDPTEFPGSNTGVAASSPDSDPTPNPTPESRPCSNLGTIWIGAWTVATMLLACYPWMRPPMLGSQWRWALGDHSGALVSLLALGTVLGCLLVALGQRGQRSHRSGATWATSALTLLCVCLSAAALTWREPLGADVLQRWPPRILSAESPELLYPLSASSAPDAAPTVWIDGATATSLDVPPGTEVARVRIDLPNGRWEAGLVLGRDLWDWRLPAPRTTQPDAGPPAPMFFWWTGSGEDTTLARRYRAYLDLQRTGEGAPPWRLRIQRSETLPDATTIDVRQLAVLGAHAAEESR